MSAPIPKRLVSVLTAVVIAVGGLAAGCKPIHEASSQGDVATVEKLLRRGVDPSKKNWQNSTPLHEAARGGHLDVVKVLIHNGADVNRGGDTYQKPLHVAAQAGHPEVVTYLLAHGAETSKVLHGGPDKAPSCLLLWGHTHNPNMSDPMIGADVGISMLRRSDRAAA